MALTGYTCEGFPVHDLPLAFCSSVERRDNDWFCLDVMFEYNKTPDGKNRPYVVITISKLTFQFGWLF